RLIQAADNFIDIKDKSIFESAKIIHDYQIDVLIDLKGYSQGSRLGICSYRPAPIQISYLGFPGPIAAEYIDAILADSIVVSSKEVAYYQDKILFLPHCYQVNDGQQIISKKPLSKEQAGLPKDAFVFASFNQCYKIEPHLFKAWMYLLHQCPNAILWLWVTDPNA